METPRIWHLNFDADLEFASGDAFKPDPIIKARFSDLRSRAIGLVPIEDRLLEDADDADGARGFCFSPTPSAKRALSAKGAMPIASPPFEVLRHVNGRRACFDLGIHLPGAAWITDVDHLVQLLQAANVGSKWRARAPWGFAGRGAVALRAPLVRENERAWIVKTIATQGGVELVPWVERRMDFAFHGFLDARGVATFGEPTRQICSEKGQWESSARVDAGDFRNSEQEELRQAGAMAAHFLQKSGYFGPFGIDAFRWNDEGRERFHPICDLNARYSMGWAIGMGDRRPDLDAK